MIHLATVMDLMKALEIVTDNAMDKVDPFVLQEEVVMDLEVPMETQTAQVMEMV